MFIIHPLDNVLIYPLALLFEKTKYLIYNKSDRKQTHITRAYFHERCLYLMCHRHRMKINQV